MHFFDKPFIKYAWLLSLTLFWACQSESKKVAVGFYHWKTGFNPAPLAGVAALQPTQLYVKCFDVDKRPEVAEAQPLAVVEGLSVATWPQGQALVPTVFITNRTFSQLSEWQIDTLVAQIYTLLERKIGGIPVREYQIDCDWTASTRQRFFLFLARFKQKIGSNKLLSATIRFHQVKDKAIMGLPPVDKGLLMAYNMGNLDDIKTQNSIIDVATVAAYAPFLRQYPLPLDLALPIFSWAVLWRDGQAVQLLNNTTTADCRTPFFRQLSDTHFEVVTAHYFKGTRLFPDDVLRIETPPLSTLEKTAHLLRENIQNDSLTLSFYHLDTACLAAYPPTLLSKLVAILKEKE